MKTRGGEAETRNAKKKEMNQGSHINAGKGKNPAGDAKYI